MANYIINNPGSGTYTIPSTTLQTGDSLEFNNTSSGTSSHTGTVINFSFPNTYTAKLTATGASGCSGNTGTKAARVSSIVPLPVPAGTKYYSTLTRTIYTFNSPGYTTAVATAAVATVAALPANPGSGTYTYFVTAESKIYTWTVNAYDAGVSVISVANSIYVPFVPNNKFVLIGTNDVYTTNSTSTAYTQSIWRGGYGAKVSGPITIKANTLYKAIVGTKGYFYNTAVISDGSTGAAGGATYLFEEDAAGLYTIGGQQFNLLCAAGSGGGTNDYGYQNSPLNGNDASAIIYDVTTADPSVASEQVKLAILGATTNPFTGKYYTRSNCFSYGGFGYGFAGDDSRASAPGSGYSLLDKGSDIASATSYFASGGKYEGLTSSSVDGKLTFEILNNPIITYIGEKGINVGDSGSNIAYPIYTKFNDIFKDTIGDIRLNLSTNLIITEQCITAANSRGGGIWEEVVNPAITTLSNQVSNKVDKVTTASVIYANDASGTLSPLTYSPMAISNAIAQRSSVGQLTVATTPAATTDAASKAYVDMIASSLNPSVVLPPLQLFAKTAPNGLTVTKPTTSANIAVALSGNNPTTTLLPYVTTTLVTPSALSNYDGIIYCNTLDAARVYTITASWEYGATVIANGTGYIDVDATFGVANIRLNTISQTFTQIPIGSTLNLRLVINKDAGGNATINIATGGNTATSFTRNGSGEVFTTDVQDIDQSNIKLTQWAKNRQYEAALATKLDKAEVLDYVVASANNLSGTSYTQGWYRKYKSGWVEQGGLANGLSYITFPLQMANTLYAWQAWKQSIAYFYNASAGLSTSGFAGCVTLYGKTTIAQATTPLWETDMRWEVKGQGL